MRIRDVTDTRVLHLIRPHGETRPIHAHGAGTSVAVSSAGGDMRIRLVWVVVVALSVGCFDDEPEGTAAPADAGVSPSVVACPDAPDAGVGIDSGDDSSEDAGADAEPSPPDGGEDAAIDTCIGPFVTIESAAIDHLTEDGVANAVIASNLCPNAPVVADQNGSYSIQVPQGKDFYLRATHAGYVTSISPELHFESDGLTVVRLFPDAPIKGPLSTLFASGPLFAPLVLSDDRYAPSGVAVAVTGAIALVTYPDAAWLPTRLATTGSSGHVVVHGMSAQAILERSAAKAGCAVVWLSNNETGRLRFENGAVTTHATYVACE